MLTVLRERAATGLTLGGGVVLLAAALIITLSLGPLPDGADAANAANHGLTSLLFLGPLTTGVAAAQAGRDQRGHMHALARSTRRGVLGSGIVLAGAISAWAVLAYSGIFIAAYLRGSNGLLRWSDVSLVALALSLIVLCATIGVVLGSRYESTRAPLVVTVLTFAVLYGGAYLEIWSARWATVYPGTAFPIHLQPNVGLNIGKAAVALSICLILAATGIQHGRRWWQSGALLGLVAGVALMLTAPDWPAVESHTDDPVCSASTRYSVCAWPQQADRIPGTLAALGRLDDMVGHVYPLPTNYRQAGAGADEPGDVRLGSLAIIGRTESEERVMADLAVRSLPPGTCPDAASEQARDSLSEWLQYTTQGMIPAGSDARQEEVAGWVEQVLQCQR